MSIWVTGFILPKQFYMVFFFFNMTTYCNALKLTYLLSKYVLYLSWVPSKTPLKDITTLHRRYVHKTNINVRIYERFVHNNLFELINSFKCKPVRDVWKQEGAKETNYSLAVTNSLLFRSFTYTIYVLFDQIIDYEHEKKQKCHGWNLKFVALL